MTAKSKTKSQKESKYNIGNFLIKIVDNIENQYLAFKNLGLFSKIFIISTLTVFVLSKINSCGGDARITGKIEGDTYTAKTKIYKDANSSILFGQGSEYEYILIHVSRIAKENPNINQFDINLIIEGDDGYGNTKIANWPHLIFQGYLLSELKRYSNLDKMSYSEKADMLDKAGMSLLKDYKGDLSPRVFTFQSSNQ